MTANGIDIKTVEIIGGRGKLGQQEGIGSLLMQRGTVYALVGRTGSGKSRLIADIESVSSGEGITRRRILINGKSGEELEEEGRSWAHARSRLVAHLSQSMNFVLDLPVLEFLQLRCDTREADRLAPGPAELLREANRLAGEPILPGQLLTRLSGGQSRALMIADVAWNSRAPVVLVDEVENAGIDKREAMKLLAGRDKIVLMATHDPLLALSADMRIVMEEGVMRRCLVRSEQEQRLFKRVAQVNDDLEQLRACLREGRSLKEEEWKDALQRILE
ncbi:MAG: transporter ATP-binding protein [Paenibacillaceae bacterium]|jgi:ABC-type lipoprotein export system ATPase subunit|nr:transporter ATP-binding protein [Paenibacillaceae bacterium]